jgi:hypothetical protein
VSLLLLERFSSTATLQAHSTLGSNNTFDMLDTYIDTDREKERETETREMRICLRSKASPTLNGS